MAFKNPFSTAQLAQEFIDQIEKISRTEDKFLRLTSYVDIKEQLEKTTKRLSSVVDTSGTCALLINVSAVAIFGVSFLSLSLPLALALGIGAGFLLTSVVFFPSLRGLDPLLNVRNSLRETVDGEIKSTTIEQLRASPFAGETLDKVPALAARFQPAATRALLLSDLPESALAPQAPAQKM